MGATDDPSDCGQPQIIITNDNLWLPIICGFQNLDQGSLVAVHHHRGSDVVMQNYYHYHYHCGSAVATQATVPILGSSLAGNQILYIIWGSPLTSGSSCDFQPLPLNICSCPSLPEGSSVAVYDCKGSFVATQHHRE